MEPPGSKRPRYCLGNDEIEIVESFRNSSSPTPISSLDHGNPSSTTAVPPLNTSELISFDAEVAPHDQYDVLGDTKPLNTSVIQQPNTSAPTKPARRMLFKPVLPRRKISPTSSSVPNSTSDSLSATLSVAEGHSKNDAIEVMSRPQDAVPLHTKTSSHLPLPSPRHHEPPQRHSLPKPQLSRVSTQKTLTQGVSKSCTPRLLSLPPPQDSQVAEEVEVQEKGVSLSKEDHGNTTDTDVELVVDLLLHGTPEESHNRLSHNRLSDPLPEEIMEDLQLHASQVKDDDPSDDDVVAVEGLATHFLQGSAATFFFFEENDVLTLDFCSSSLYSYLQLFDVDRLKLEAAYAKNALFSCRVHHVQDPSFSMAGLFAPESATSRQGFNVSRK